MSDTVDFVLDRTFMLPVNCADVSGNQHFQWLCSCLERNLWRKNNKKKNGSVWAVTFSHGHSINCYYFGSKLTFLIEYVVTDYLNDYSLIYKGIYWFARLWTCQKHVPLLVSVFLKKINRSHIHPNDLWVSHGSKIIWQELIRCDFHTSMEDNYVTRTQSSRSNSHERIKQTGKIKSP